MQCATHRLIADGIYKTLCAAYGIELDYKSLMHGSVAPDLKPSMVVIPHTKGHSLDFLTKQINSLTNMQIPKSKQENKSFSFNLGVIIHFLSDYFCIAHNNIKYLNPITHYIYEYRLRWYFSKRMKIGDFSKMLQGFNLHSDTFEFISNQHQAYLKKKRTMSNDYKFSVETSLKVAASILSHCLNNSLANSDVSGRIPA